jgi:hypothetical protein
MKYTKGQSGNPSGKPKGTKNKLTQDSVKQLLSNQAKDFESKLETVSNNLSGLIKSITVEQSEHLQREIPKLINNAVKTNLTANGLI